MRKAFLVLILFLPCTFLQAQISSARPQVVYGHWKLIKMKGQDNTLPDTTYIREGMRMPDILIDVELSERTVLCYYDGNVIKGRWYILNNSLFFIFKNDKRLYEVVFVSDTEMALLYTSPVGKDGKYHTTTLLYKKVL